MQPNFVDHLFAFVFLAISAVFACIVYIETGKNLESLIWSIYVFGAVFIPGIITVYPGFKKQRDSTELELKVPRGKNLSRIQAIIIFSWIVGLGLVIVYFTQINGLSLL